MLKDVGSPRFASASATSGEKGSGGIFLATAAARQRHDLGS
jgi:hypothetical protein